MGPVWIWASSLVRISVAFMLLRIKNMGLWRAGLWASIIIQVAIASGRTLFELLKCRPLRAVWYPGLPGSTCVAVEKVQKVIIATSGSHFLSLVALKSNHRVVVFIFFDIAFSLVPIGFLRNVRGPLREKIVIAILMALGVVASVAAIIKLIFIKNYGFGGDFLWDLDYYILWAWVEVSVGSQLRVSRA